MSDDVILFFVTKPTTDEGNVKRKPVVLRFEATSDPMLFCGLVKAQDY
jgi:hypothetical protein